MSRFLSDKLKKLVPYTPGEQPKDTKYIKLNTNESPFPPSPKAIEAASEAAKTLNLYSDPECTRLHIALSKHLGISTDEVLTSNGSDEILYFAFSAFCDEKTPAIFPDITYGFYPVFADVLGIPYETVPLKDDFSVDIKKFKDTGKTVFIANPNAPTGIALGVSQVEEILKSNPSNIVVIDEAYVDFGAESCVPLIKKYNNLLVTGTFSKSRSMAGARLGFGAASPELINDLKTVKYSFNPYNVNSMTMAAGIGALSDEEYTFGNIKKIIETREYTKEQFEKLGFTVTDSLANFIFAKSDRISGKDLYLKLKEKGILIRHFDKERISDYNRITVGTKEQMEILIKAVGEILEGN